MEREIKANKIKSKDFLKLIAKSKPKYSYFAIGMLSGILGAILQLIVPQMIQPLISGFAQGIDYGLLGKSFWSTSFLLYLARWVLQFLVFLEKM